MRSDRRAGGLAVGLFLLLSGHPAIRLSAQTIDTIVVINHNVFDKRDNFISNLANALHITTRQAVIRRALLLERGQPYDSARALESERALRGLDVFRDVRIDTTRVNGRFALVVETADGWSTRPTFGFTSVGGGVTWEAGLVEQNLLGSATTLAGIYRDTPDRTDLELLYRAPRFFWRRDALALGYQNLSDGHSAAWGYGLPYYQTSQPWALVTDGEVTRARILVYRDGLLVTQPQRRATIARLRGGIALTAESRAYRRLWLGAQWRREDFDSAAAAPFPRTETGTVGLGIAVGHVRLIGVHDFDSFGRREELDLTQELSLGAWAAPRAWGYAGGHDGIGPEVKARVSTVWHGGFAVLGGEAHGVYRSGGLDSGLVKGNVTIAGLLLSPRQTTVLHVEAGALRHPVPGGEFDLWRDGVGPRLFGVHSFTGTRTVWGFVEQRIPLSEDWMDLIGVGIAPFVDYGGAWYRDYGTAVIADERARLGGDVGLSLRVGPTRAIRGDVSELAVGYRFGAGTTGKRWAVTLRRAISLQ